jgi:hypothetical protein
MIPAPNISGGIEVAMSEPEKITIIEGPPPTFEASNDPLLLGMAESPRPMQVVMCHLRANNGPELTERCYRAWSKGETIRLEFKSEEGLTLQAPIVASRWAELPEGHLLMLWIRLEDEDISIDLDFEIDDFDGDFDDEFDESLDDSDLDFPI